jgi:hypothetical protein
MSDHCRDSGSCVPLASVGGVLGGAVVTVVRSVERQLRRRDAERTAPSKRSPTPYATSSVQFRVPRFDLHTAATQRRNKSAAPSAG